MCALVVAWLRQRAHDPRVMGSNPGASSNFVGSHIYADGALEGN